MYNSQMIPEQASTPFHFGLFNLRRREAPEYNELRWRESSRKSFIHLVNSGAVHHDISIRKRAGSLVGLLHTWHEDCSTSSTRSKPASAQSESMSKCPQSPPPFRLPALQRRGLETRAAFLTLFWARPLGSASYGNIRQ